MAYILSFKKDMQFRVYSFKFPYSNTKHSKYSFSTFSIKILNLSLFNYITKKMTLKPNLNTVLVIILLY
jgi:hypothetical protein